MTYKWVRKVDWPEHVFHTEGCLIVSECQIERVPLLQIKLFSHTEVQAKDAFRYSLSTNKVHIVYNISRFITARPVPPNIQQSINILCVRPVINHMSILDHCSEHLIGVVEMEYLHVITS